MRQVETMSKTVWTLIVAGCLNACALASSPPPLTAASVRVVPVQDVEWQALNPARGAASPRAGTLWGNRNDAVPTGFLARFAPGFASPPHIHNVSYRAVVIEGEIHNDDPKAEQQWMGPGAFWTQPQGDSHVTAARGPVNLALVEIDSGPYLVRPPEQAFASQEQPFNIHADDIAWSTLQVGEGSRSVAKAPLWGQYLADHWNGSLLRFPAGFDGRIESSASVFHAVVIRGELRHDAAKNTTLLPGSYFGAEGPSSHGIQNALSHDTVVYIRTNGEFHVRRVGEE